MKLSEKYLDTNGKSGELALNPDRICKVYGEICSLEAQQTLLVANPQTFPQDAYIDKLAQIVNALEEIKTREGL